MVPLVLGALLCASGCGQKEDKKDSGTEVAPKAKEALKPVTAPMVDVDALVEHIGVEPGAFEIEEGIGSEGVITVRNGTVALRRAGEEEFKDITEDNAKVYTGDQIRTTADSSAVVTLADMTVVELAEFTTIAMGDRDSTADPASSVVVMAGVARFTVSERGKGEGPFLVFTSAGIIGAKGTTYAVGVAASGDVRVGVEVGEVEVAGGKALDAPVVVGAGSHVAVSEDGAVGKVLEFTSDDWGQWRDEIEAKANALSMAQAHLKAAGKLQAELDKGYRDLEIQAEAVTEAEAPLIEAQASSDGAAYLTAAHELAAEVEASYQTSMRLQFLTYAMLSRTYITSELYLRYPEVVGPVFVPAAPHIYGAILYQKKFHGVVNVHVLPLRAKYYYHHPHGRAQAVALGYPVPPFFVKQKLKKLPDGAVSGKLKFKMYKTPIIAKFNGKKKVWVGPPVLGWASGVKLGPHKVRGQVGWYIKVKEPKAELWLVKVRFEKGKAVFKPGKPQKRGSVGARIGVGPSHKKDPGDRKGRGKKEKTRNENKDADKFKGKDKGKDDNRVNDKEKQLSKKKEKDKDLGDKNKKENKDKKENKGKDKDKDKDKGKNKGKNK
jgi:hypothetical protein